MARPRVLGHVAVVATGAPTRGPGAVGRDGAGRPLLPKPAATFWNGLAARAGAANVTIDAVCVGGDACRGPGADALARVAARAGGRVALAPDGEVAAQLAAALSARTAVDAVVQIRWTPPLALGAAAAATAAAGGATLTVDARARVATARLPSPRAGDCFAVPLDVAAPLNGAAAAVQVVVDAADAATGARVVRTATRAVSPARDAASALAGVHPDLTALLLVKQGAAAALARGATEDACASVETSFVRHVAAAAAATGTRVGDTARRTAWLPVGGGRRLWRLPRSLVPLADALYGAARSPAFASPDAGVRERALAAVAGGAPDAALRAVRPGLYVVDPATDAARTPTLVPVPPADVALAACPAALLDCGDTLFVWAADDAASAVRAAVADAAARLAAARAPPPHVRTVTTATPDAARAAAWRLVPMHRDDDADVALQVAPLWGALDAGARGRARARVPPSADPSFVEWCREAGAEPMFDLGGDRFL